MLDIQPSDLVMKARHCIFHLDCFRCTTCDVILRKGDLFGMFDDVLYCRMHFEQMQQQQPQPPQQQGQPVQPQTGLHPPPGLNPGDPDAMFPPFPPGPGGYPPQHFEGGWFPPGAEFPPTVGPGSVSPGDFPYDNNNEPMLKKRRGRKKRKAETFAAMNGYIDGSGFPGGPPGMDSNASKAKRARTSFKHHQLRIMKAHFQINQNPDSRELKMLSQKTCLDKKVLQVRYVTSSTLVPN
jgi:LIM homeobox protein 2/9